MKDWHLRLGTTVGVLMAVGVLWGQFGDTLGLPGFSFSRGSDGERERRHEFQWEGRIPAGQTVEIKGINGSVTAEPASGNEVEVVAVKTGRRSDPRQVRIQVLQHSDGVTVCAVYPSAGGSPNECGRGSRGRMNTRNNDVQVRFVVKVPSGVRLAASTVNGSIRAEGLEGDLTAETVNGSIDVSTSGRAEASTVNGSIKARIGATSLVDDLTFNTVNGSIVVYLPDGINAEIAASAVGGRLASEFPLTVSRRRMSGVIGSGGHELNMSTVNGTIELKRGR